jgi:hypothetical protein
MVLFGVVEVNVFFLLLICGRKRGGGFFFIVEWLRKGG